jgi:hypothetical protein
MSVKVLHQNIDPSLAKDKTLPSHSYIVSYYLDGKKCHDIAIGHKRAAIFDLYWDLYRNDLISIEWTDGRVNPKLWQDPKEKKKTK